MIDPNIIINFQYIKKLNFETSNNVKNIFFENIAPSTFVNISTDAKRIGDSNYEVNIYIESAVNLNKNKLFTVNIIYSGIFTIKNISHKSNKDLNNLLLIKAPEFLFPFARSIVSNITRESGFSPLILSPVDFNTIHNNKKTD
jgi:preprotein translocase subunit SecB